MTVKTGQFEVVNIVIGVKLVLDSDRPAGTIINNITTLLSTTTLLRFVR